jgi:hypothetical protein
MAAGGTSQRLKPGFAIVRSRSNNDATTRSFAPPPGRDIDPSHDTT